MTLRKIKNKYSKKIKKMKIKNNNKIKNNKRNQTLINMYQIRKVYPQRKFKRQT